MTQASAGAMHWSKPSGNRFSERSAKAIGLSEALVERQLAWASRGRRWHTRWISWGSLGLPTRYSRYANSFLAPQLRMNLTAALRKVEILLTKRALFTKRHTPVNPDRSSSLRFLPGERT